MFNTFVEMIITKDLLLTPQFCLQPVLEKYDPGSPGAVCATGEYSISGVGHGELIYQRATCNVQINLAKGCQSLGGVRFSSKNGE